MSATGPLTATSSEPGELIVFWDYDTQWGWDHSRLKDKSAPWGHLEFECAERVLELHARHGIPACFAVVGAAALPGERPYHDPEQIRRIHAAGHEVASHSFHHEWLPGLSSALLDETVRRSREALEQCIGAPVRTFVPPFNQPFDHARGWSISLSERREAFGARTDLSRLCRALRDAGYRFCRVAYRPLGTRIAEWASGRRHDRPGRLEVIDGITCVRINTPCGFGPETQKMLDVCAERGGLVVVYGHPHALRKGFQAESYLAPFLEHAQALRAAGRLRVRLPREMEPPCPERLAGAAEARA